MISSSGGGTGIGSTIFGHAIDVQLQGFSRHRSGGLQRQPGGHAARRILEVHAIITIRIPAKQRGIRGHRARLIVQARGGLHISAAKCPPVAPLRGKRAIAKRAPPLSRLVLAIFLINWILWLDIRP